MWLCSISITTIYTVHIVTLPVVCVASLLMLSCGYCSQTQYQTLLVPVPSEWELSWRPLVAEAHLPDLTQLLAPSFVLLHSQTLLRCGISAAGTQ